MTVQSQPTTLGELERASYRSRWRDGLLDLLSGIGVLAVGLGWTSELFWAPGFAVPVLLVAWIGIRKRMVEPRIGRVTFSEARRGMEQRWNRAGLLLGIGFLVFFVAYHSLRMRGGGGFEAWSQEWIAALPVSLLALLALGAAVLTGLTRFVGYAALLLATGGITTPLGMEPAPQILIAGAVITLVGLILFLRFLSTHPLPAHGEEAP